jgi:hypothetical protein
MDDNTVRPDWKDCGIRVVHAGELDTNTPQTPGMNRRCCDHLRAGRRLEALGRNRKHSSQRKDRRASSRRA